MQPSVDEIVNIGKQPLLSDPATQEYFLDKVGSLLGEIAPRPVDLSKALVNYPDLLALEIAERPRYLPWLLERSTVMVFGPRGIGKTFFQLALSVALTTGKPLWNWDCPAPVGVLYVDGEMQLDELRQRAQALMENSDSAVDLSDQPACVERCGGKDLVLTSGRDAPRSGQDPRIHPEIRVVVLDNISCLFSGIREDRQTRLGTDQRPAHPLTASRIGYRLSPSRWERRTATGHQWPGRFARYRHSARQANGC